VRQLAGWRRAGRRSSTLRSPPLVIERSPTLGRGYLDRRPFDVRDPVDRHRGAAASSITSRAPSISSGAWERSSRGQDGAGHRANRIVAGAPGHVPARLARAAQRCWLQEVRRLAGDAAASGLPNPQMQPTGRTEQGSVRPLIADGDQWSVGWCGGEQDRLQLICKSLGRSRRSLLSGRGFQGGRQSSGASWRRSSC
jgi:hypothetical protein